ncbi:MAG: MBOAT family protein [Alphaproteobacteria bacterium]|nr:MBOAT family protein [Alphaproteobacteria bacterium]
MLFNSFPFIFAFLPVTLAGFLLLSRGGNRLAAIWWLVFASLFFYGWWDWRYVGLIVLTVLFNYALGNDLARRGQGGYRRALLAGGVAANLALLGYFKYAMFVAGNLNFLFGTDWDVGRIILPLGISFFTFQQIAYLVDAYRHQAERSSLAEYALFVTFFPQLIAGPIVHHKDTIPQFRDGRTFRPRLNNFAVGLTIFAIGLFKKTVIADGLAFYATPVFALADQGGNVTMLEAWSGALAYTFQLYFDFSGYSDMAIGLARLFGVRLPLNFFSPYKSTSIVEFWRRWHMTLSRFLRDYLYIPLGGNRGGAGLRYRNVLVTMLLGGLWHGAGWNFVLWGAIHGVALVVNQLWVASGLRRLPPLIAGLLTFLLVVFAWVFFRAETLDGALAILRGMIGLGGLAEGRRLLPGTGDIVFCALALAAAAAIAFLAPNTAEIMRRYRPALLETLRGSRPAGGRLFRWLVWRPSLPWAVAVGGAASFAVAAIFGWQSEFLYFQF